MTPAQLLTRKEARRIALQSGFRRAPSVAAALQQLGVVQLDAIPAVCHSHKLTLAARCPEVGAVGIDDALWGLHQKLCFEYPAHAAAIVPIHDWPLWGFRRRSTAAQNYDWAPTAEQRQTLRSVLDVDGPLTMRELNRGKTPGQGWAWSPTKLAVEHMVWTGDLAVVQRRGWNRVFDLAERVIPPAALDQMIDDRECVRRLIARAGAALGLATVDEYADYIRTTRAAAAAAMTANGLVNVAVEGRHEQYWADPAALSQETSEPSEPFLVGPFDNLVWNRKRVKRLFGVDLVLEAYKPVEQRKYGYFVMPLFVGDEIVGRFDVSTEAGDIVVVQSHFESSTYSLKSEEVINALDALRDAALG